jgi:alpha-glucosidase
MATTTPLGNIQDWRRVKTGIEGKTETAFFKLEVYTETIIRIQLTHQSVFDNFSYAVIASPEVIDFEVEDLQDQIVIKTSQLRAIVSKNPWHITFRDVDNNLLNEDDPSLSVRWNGEQVTAYKKFTTKRTVHRTG